MTDTTQQIVTKLDTSTVDLPKLDAAPNHLDAKGRPVFHFPVKVALTTDEGLHKHAVVTPAVKGYSAFELKSDEGTGLPMGADTAPAPLVYFAAGASFCLVSHLTGLINDRHLDVRNIEVESELSFGYIQHETGRRATCLGLRYIVDLDSAEPEADLRAVIQEAKGLCLAEAALAEPVQIQTMLAIKGDVKDEDVAAEAGTLGHAHPTAE